MGAGSPLEETMVGSFLPILCRGTVVSGEVSGDQIMAHLLCPFRKPTCVLSATESRWLVLIKEQTDHFH